MAHILNPASIQTIEEMNKSLAQLLQMSKSIMESITNINAAYMGLSLFVFIIFIVICNCAVYMIFNENEEDDSLPGK